jgi:hypothetical protein
MSFSLQELEEVLHASLTQVKGLPRLPAWCVASCSDVEEEELFAVLDLSSVAITSDDHDFSLCHAVLLTVLVCCAT